MGLGMACAICQAALPLPLQDNGTTAGPKSTVQKNGVQTVTGATTIKIKVLPSFGPTQQASSFATYATDAVTAIKAGTLPVLKTVTPENLMTHPDGVGTVWWWLDVTADLGETLSLADVSGLFTSSDSGNVLGKVVSLEGTAYSPLAPGIRADGSEVTSGPANQQVKRVIVGIGSKSFPVSSSNDEQAVKDYLNQFPNWRMTGMVSAKGVTTTVVLQKAPPKLMATMAGEGRLFMVSAEDNGDPMSYGIQSSLTLGSSEVWSSAGSIKAGQTLVLGQASGTARFVRYAP